MKLNLKVATVVLMAVVVSACSDRMSDVDQKMAEIRNSPALPIQPLPEPVVIQDFTYSAGDIRSPFLAPSLQTMQTQPFQELAVKPDVNRVKQPLENYDLSELVYRGRVVTADGQVYGLVQLPTGYVQEIKLGQYMGKSDGKILEITPTQVNLEEIVPDARVGFVHKKTSLVTPN